MLHPQIFVVAPPFVTHLFSDFSWSRTADRTAHISPPLPLLLATTYPRPTLRSEKTSSDKQSTLLFSQARVDCCNSFQHVQRQTGRRPRTQQWTCRHHAAECPTGSGSNLRVLLRTRRGEQRRQSGEMVRIPSVVEDINVWVRIYLTMYHRPESPQVVLLCVD